MLGCKLQYLQAAHYPKYSRISVSGYLAQVYVDVAYSGATYYLWGSCSFHIS